MGIIDRELLHPIASTIFMNAIEELIGSTFQDRYRIESLLSRQNGRRTFLATDLQSNDPVAIKLLIFGPDFTWDDLKLFEREAEVLKSLDHAAIPKYLNFFEVELSSGKGFALVQSYIAAQSLQQWIQGGRTFSEEDLKAIARDLLKILDYMHNRQPAVIHRDIKPSNILLADRTAHSTGKVYLVDFGSVQTAVKGGTRTIVGTYGYMPPEQFGGVTTPSSDIYALGVTLIYLATGCSPDELPQQELRLYFEDRVNLSPRLVRWIQQAIAPSIEKRLQSASQALLQLETGINSSLENVNNLIVKQPFGSKVKMRKVFNNLEVTLPHRDFNLVSILLIVITCGFVISLFLSGITALSVFSQGGMAKSEFGLAGLMYLGLCLAFLILSSIIFVVLHRCVTLILTPSTISLSYKLFNKCYWKFSAKTEHIQKIDLSSPSATRDFKGDTVKQPPQLNIWIGTKLISLGEWGQLSEPELEWLRDCLLNQL